MSEQPTSVKQNQIFALTTIILLIISGIVFTLDSPHWLYAIPILLIAIMIPILKTIWSIAGWGDKQYQRYFGDQNNVEVSYKIDLENVDDESMSEEGRKSK